MFSQQSDLQTADLLEPNKHNCIIYVNTKKDNKMDINISGIVRETLSKPPREEDGITKFAPHFSL